jgi:glutamate-5-semialdehyde dehydrogenase
MPVADSVDLASLCRETARNAKKASGLLGSVRGDLKNRWLQESADDLVAARQTIIAANQLDLDAAPGYGLTDAAIDRLRLDSEAIEKIANGLHEVARLTDPIGELIEGHTRPNGLKIHKVRVPLGVVFFIYESRPNVTADAAAICVKSGNAVILRGGKEALHSSRAIVEIMRKRAGTLGLPIDAVQLVATTDREAVGHFLKMDDLIDVAIPRGGEGLIRRVSEEAAMPVIKHFDGNCHVYIDAAADIPMAVDIVMNSKTQRMGVCNACESLVIHRQIAASVMPVLAERLQQAGVEIRGDDAAAGLAPGVAAATEADWSTEYLGPKISVRIVDSISHAIDHINRYGSHHTDAIVTTDLAASERFTSDVDSAAVVVNASTRFNDGGEFGMGAEIGISTDKFHARGPCGLRELTSYKYIVHGSGQIRT